MIDFLALVRASWLAGIPCGELCAAAHTEMFRTLALSEYGRLNMMAFRANSTNKAYT